MSFSFVNPRGGGRSIAIGSRVPKTGRSRRRGSSFLLARTVSFGYSLLRKTGCGKISDHHFIIGVAGARHMRQFAGQVGRKGLCPCWMRPCRLQSISIFHVQVPHAFHKFVGKYFAIGFRADAAPHSVLRARGAGRYITLTPVSGPLLELRPLPVRCATNHPQRGSSGQFVPRQNSRSTNRNRWRA